MLICRVFPPDDFDPEFPDERYRPGSRFVVHGLRGGNDALAVLQMVADEYETFGCDIHWFIRSDNLWFWKAVRRVPRGDCDPL